jgi:cell division septation protein DedD
MNKFNKNPLLFLSLTLFLLNSSMAENLSDWKKKDNQAKKDCVNCYADIDSDKKAIELLKSQAIVDKKEQVYSYDDSTSAPKIYHENGYKYQISASDSYSDQNHEEREKKIEHSKKIAIQVGAFRRYSGAKIYAKKYAILSSKYNVEIKTGVKDQKPIYRVQIEGFSSRAKAKEFKIKYGLTGAFLVMK